MIVSLDPFVVEQAVVPGTGPAAILPTALVRHWFPVEVDLSQVSRPA
jgi:hypothetical protein